MKLAFFFPVKFHIIYCTIIQKLTKHLKCETIKREQISKKEEKKHGDANKEHKKGNTMKPSNNQAL